jgi:hypothetical protein
MLEEEMKSTREPNWRDPSTLVGINAWEAFQVLAQIGAAFKQPTTDSSTHDERLDSLDVTREARQFADACNSLGSRLRARSDCRPGLRVAADERRQSKLTPDEEYAANCRAYHRR